MTAQQTINNEILARIKTSPAGTKIVYHIGLIGKDRGAKGLLERSGEELEINLLADQVYESYLDGFCELVQNRLGEMRYEYIAIILSPTGRTERSLRNRQLFDSQRTTTSQYVPKPKKPSEPKPIQMKLASPNKIALKPPSREYAEKHAI